MGAYKDAVSFARLLTKFTTAEILERGMDTEDELGCTLGLRRWALAGYPTLQPVTEQYAAALACTDFAGVDAQAPWPVFAVRYPGCILPLSAVLYTADKVYPLGDRVQMSEPVWRAVHRIALGMCLQMESTPPDLQPKPRIKGRRKRKRDFAHPDVYVVGEPVKIDCRQALRESLNPKVRGPRKAPTVNWLVRGHWRNQACGPQRSQRKRIWIQPHWGNTHAPTLVVRPHVVGGD